VLIILVDLFETVCVFWRYGYWLVSAIYSNLISNAIYAGFVVARFIFQERPRTWSSLTVMIKSLLSKQSTTHISH